MSKLFQMIFISVLISENLIFAKDKGIYGELFEIAEKDLLEEIQEKLSNLEKTGKLLESQEEIQKRITKNISEPKAISGIIHTKKARTFEFDPTIEVTVDLKDHKGKIFAKKGDKHNPCDHASFSKTLLFIDGESKKHIAWLKKKMKDCKNVKIILIAGSPLKLSEELGIPIYFDQSGAITKKLEIKQVPAMVFQETGNKVLTIREEIVDED